MAKGQQVGYIRVSSTGQNTDRQLMDYQLDKIFTEKVSGKSSENRKQLAACLSHLREGDTLNVHSIDRLARNLLDLQKIILELINKGVAVRFHKENMTFSGDNNNPMQVLMMQMLGSFAEFERSMIKERQSEGIASAKQNGVKFGAPPKLTAPQIKNLLSRVKAGEQKAALAKEFGISRPTLYEILKKAA